MGIDYIVFHEGDLPDGLDLTGSVAIDTETTGLNFNRDRLCLVQLSSGDGFCHLVRFKARKYNAPNLCRLLTDAKVQKIFHYARFDVGALKKFLGVDTANIYCTKIASKLARTNGQSHSLKTLCSELLDIGLEKENQCSDWGADTLSESQMIYAANDVLYLHDVKKHLAAMLAREGRTDLAQKCFDFIMTRANLDVAGFTDDIFAH